MTIRVYKPRVGKLDRRSLQCKRDSVLLERKQVERAGIYSEIGILDIYTKEHGREEFGYGDCDIEIIDGEPDDGVTDGLSLPY